VRAIWHRSHRAKGGKERARGLEALRHSVSDRVTAFGGGGQQGRTVIARIMG